jgi:hypothetical protein
MALANTSLPTGILWQTQGVLQWLHLPHSPTRVITLYHNIVAKLIAMGCFCMVKLWGLELSLIIVPFTKEQQAWLWCTNTRWQNALTNFTGQLWENLPSSKLLNFASQHAFIFPHNIQEDPCLRLLWFFLMLQVLEVLLTFLSRTKGSTNRFFPCSACWASGSYIGLSGLCSVPFNLYADSACLWCT